MRKINLSNQRHRNAEVGFEISKSRHSIKYRCKDGSDYSSVRLLKSTVDTSTNRLIDKIGSDLTDSIIASDPEIDMEATGKYLRKVKKIYLTPDGKVAYRLSRQTVFYTPDGIEKSVQKSHTTQANINADVPLRWTGRLVSKDEAARKFVFSRKYQLRHVNGLTFDFLYDMARELHQRNSMMMLGAGIRGNSPLVLSTGGVPYRAFLEGRVDGDKYCLIMHLTNLELKAVK